MCSGLPLKRMKHELVFYLWKSKMVNFVSVTITLLSIIIHLEFVILSGVRQKRILYGKPAFRNERDFAPSYRYYVFISRTRPSAFWQFIGRNLNPNPKDLSCGGSLLTPYIIQTAGHCVSYAIDQGKKSSLVKIKSHVEYPLYVYVGHNVATDMKYWLDPQIYSGHQKTRYLNVKNTYLTIWYYDYGYIITQTNTIERTPLAKVNYAPVYPEKDLISFYNEAVQNEYMCLHVGHGLWDVITTEENGLQVSSEASDPIRWGWRSIMNERDCEYVLYPDSTKRVYAFNYTQHNWVCCQSWKVNQRVPALLYHTNRGDSGGPVSCNDVYFAVVSSGNDPGAGTIVSVDSAIVHVKYTNSAEARERMIAFYTKYAFPDERSTSSTKLIARFLLLLAMIVNSTFSSRSF